MQNISIDEFYNNFENLGQNDLILDVRSPGEFNEGHLKNARNISHEEVGSIADELKDYDYVYVHCKMGGRAKMASQILKNFGLSNIVCIGEGGMQRWAEQGWPME
jgi:rhodanese-related sulfurtransferase